MKFQINEIQHGFKMIEEFEIKELKSIARVFNHEKSGARLLHLENDDDNKVFSIGFRTPPSDNTGVPHIVEHCVLSGSRKYKTKEPFMDMVKGSLKTFINAMTFSDKTIYPVASRNEKDFYNLMDVYLDAVFYPSIYELPQIFMQEGWHYKLNDTDGDITYNGIVYNEMRGAYSSPETVLDDEIAKSLYPDGCYKYSSGGNPDFIPDLTYQGFLDFHKRYYHPSNSYIYLYGNGDIEDQLKYINDNYLSNFEKIEIDSKINIQEPFNTLNEVESFYSISKEDKDENKTYLSLNFVLGNTLQKETYLVNNILKEVLITSSAAPLKKALLDAGIGEDVFYMNTDGIHSNFCIVAKNTSKDKKEKFKNIVFDTLKNLVNEGIDKNLIKASINKIEYSLREATNFPTKGIIYHISSLDSWLYDSHPTNHLQYEETLNSLREKIDKNYFEEFIEEKMIDNNHSSLVTMIPKKGLEDEKDDKLKTKLEKYKNSLSSDQINKIIEENEKLNKKQLSPDSPEAKATIPKLLVSDVDSKVDIIPQEVIKDENITLLYHDVFTSKISYIDFLFDISHIDKDLLPYVSLLTDILGKLDTSRLTYSDLSNEIYINTGGISFGTDVYVENGNDTKFYPKLTVKSKAIGEKITSLVNLVKELATSTKIEDKKRIKELIQVIKSRLEMSIFRKGNVVSSTRVASYFSKSINYREQLNGVSFYWFICDICANFDNNSDEIIENLNKVYNKLFNSNNLLISFTGDKNDFNILKKNISSLKNELSNEPLESIDYDFEESKSNEGILSSANVQYVSKGYNFKKLDYKYNASMQVLSTILNGDYLHDRVRARGGAYGAGISFSRSGNVTTFSYRDPNLIDTIKVYDEAYDYIANLDITEDELTNYIIGTISKLDFPTTPHMKGSIALSNYISNISYEQLQKERSEVLNTKLSDIKSHAKLLKEVMDKNYLCVLGNENKIKENESMFNSTIKLNK